MYCGGGVPHPGPAARAAAPMMPPMSAWLLDVGRPHNHVIRSHAIAPTTPAMMMAIEWRNAGSLNGKAFTPRTFVSMIPLPIVSAIAFVMKTIPTKFPNAAMATAFVGVRTFVATIVAIAFAASWNPLKKSNEKTTRIATMMIAERSAMPSPCLRASLRPAARDPDGSLILRHNVAQHIGDILAVVRGLLEDLRDLLELDDRHGILLTEERRDRVVHEVVGDVLVAVVLPVLDPRALHRRAAELVQQVRRGAPPLVDGGGEPLEEVEKLALLRDNPRFQTHGPSLPVNAVVLVHH